MNIIQMTLSLSLSLSLASSLSVSVSLSIRGSITERRYLIIIPTRGGGRPIVTDWG